MEEALPAVGLVSAGSVREHDEKLGIARLFQYRIEPPLASVLAEYQRARGLHLELHAENIHDGHVMYRLVALKARVHHPVGAHGKVLEAPEMEAMRVGEIADAHPEVAGALDDVEAQCAAFEHGRFAARVGSEVERTDRFPFVRDPTPSRRDEAQLLAAAHEIAGVWCECGIIEGERVGGGAAETVVE